MERWVSSLFLNACGSDFLKCVAEGDGGGVGLAL